MTTRERAIQWFNEKDIYNKSELSHKYFKDTVSYNFTALTGNEIEQIWQKEVKNKYLDRLKKQYYELKRNFLLTEKNYRQIRYNAMREFCLDCELIPFTDIEVMEYEVNQSFTS